MALADVLWVEVVTTPLVYCHLAGLTAVTLTTETPDPVMTLLTVGSLHGMEWRHGYVEWNSGTVEWKHGMETWSGIETLRNGNTKMHRMEQRHKKAKIENGIETVHVHVD